MLLKATERLESTPKNKSLLPIVNFLQSPEIRNREARSDITVLDSECFNFHVFNETVTFLLSRPHVAVGVEFLCEVCIDHENVSNVRV